MNKPFQNYRENLRDRLNFFQNGLEDFLTQGHPRGKAKENFVDDINRIISVLNELLKVSIDLDVVDETFSESKDIKTQVSMHFKFRKLKRKALRLTKQYEELVIKWQ